jgi:site-specific DNA-methyltransferase (adenine-specific)
VGRVGMTQHASGTNSVYGKFKGSERSLVRDGVVDSGGRSRFFYCTKVSRVERNIGLPAGQKCEHPTLKPLKLTEYLARLLLPPARTREREPSSPPRTLLVPFCGAGSEMIGGLCAGWDEVVGIDSDPKACEWAEQRIEGATAAVEDARQVKILHGP